MTDSLLTDFRLRFIHTEDGLYLQSGGGMGQKVAQHIPGETSAVYHLQSSMQLIFHVSWDSV